jgi:hypothetical protein
MRVHFELFQSLGKPWNTLCEEAAAFASKLPPERLISIAHSEDQDDAVLTVWYWKDDVPSTAREDTGVKRSPKAATKKKS